MSPRRTFLIGLTGGIGCGKTTVANGFAERGVTIIDADVLAHELTRPGGAAIAALRTAFGEAYLTAEGALDRVRMRKLAFEDDGARQTLEAILHPMIRAQTNHLIERSDSAYTILVIPLLFESREGKARVDRALVVDCSEEEQIGRVMQRSKMSRSEVIAIMARQVKRSERLSLADDVIDNSGSVTALEPAIARLHAQYLALAKSVGL